MNIPEYDHVYRRSTGEDLNKWFTEIPFIPFPADWEIQVIPPFAGATARFRVRKQGPSEVVSVYLDCYSTLGWSDGKPYWEVYPVDGDVGRCAIDDVSGLIELISASDRMREE